MGKRKRAQVQHHDSFPRTFVTKFGMVEVDNISKAWKFQKVNDRRKEIYSKRAVLEGSKGAKDYISIMPDDVLQLIISYLPMREGARTSILSGRWKDLWSSSASFLNFNTINIFGHDYKKKQCKSRSRKKENCKFVNRVDQILKHRQGKGIDAFRVCSPLGRDSTSSINRWIKLAASQGVRELDLNFVYGRYRWMSDKEKLYKFPLKIFNHGEKTSCLRHLHLKSCIFRLPRNVQNFKCLLSLSLKKTWISQEVVTRVMLNCPFLEWLSLNRCFFLKSESVKFAGTYLHLKHLSIFSCSPLAGIELDAENLVSFEYKGKQPSLSFKNVPRLVRVYCCLKSDVNLDGLSSILNKISTSLPQLETLFLSKEHEALYLTDVPKIKILPAELPIFLNLKQLALSITTTNYKSLVELTSLLEVCPMLQKLQLDLRVLEDSDYRGSVEVTRVARRYYDKLKEIDIYGFRGYGNEIELVVYLLKGATGLETMEIYTDTPWFYCGDGKWRVAKGIPLKSGIPLREARKLLQKELRPTTKLIISSPR